MEFVARRREGKSATGNLKGSMFVQGALGSMEKRIEQGPDVLGAQSMINVNMNLESDTVWGVLGD